MQKLKMVATFISNEEMEFLEKRKNEHGQSKAWVLRHGLQLLIEKNIL